MGPLTVIFAVVAALGLPVMVTAPEGADKRPVVICWPKMVMSLIAVCTEPMITAWPLTKTPAPADRAPAVICFPKIAMGPLVPVTLAIFTLAADRSTEPAAVTASGTTEVPTDSVPLEEPMARATAPWLLFTGPRICMSALVPLPATAGCSVTPISPWWLAAGPLAVKAPAENIGCLPVMLTLTAPAAAEALPAVIVPVCTLKPLWVPV